MTYKVFLNLNEFFRNLEWKLRATIMNNLQAGYEKFGKRWRAIKPKPELAKEQKVK